MNSLFIPSKFILVSCHFVTSLMAYYGAKENIVADFQTQQIDTSSSEYKNAYNSVMACVLLSLIGLGLEIVFIITGITMFYDTSNFISNVQYKKLFACMQLESLFIVNLLQVHGPTTNYGTFGLASCMQISLHRLIPLLMEIVASCFGNILYGTAFTRRKSRKGN